MGARRIEFNPDIFNPLYFHLEEAFHNPKIRFIWSYGGSSAGKSYSFAQLAVKELISERDNNFLILRKYAVDIKDSIFSDFKKIIEEWGLNEYFTIQINYIECKLTGSYIRFRGLDDSEKVKGISNFKRIALEEISQFDFEDFKQIRKRLRGRKGQQIIGLFNPISEMHWIKEKIFDIEILQEIESNITGKWVNSLGNMQIMKVTYLDNKYIVGPNFIDEHTIADFEHDKKYDNNYYNVYGLGNWGKLRTGGEFWKDFKPSEHVQRVEWNPELAIHLSFDDNVNPYLPCGVFQIDDKEIYQIDEFCLPDPLNKVRHVCKKFMDKYPRWQVPKLYIYGDRTSIKENTTKEKGSNFFTEIETELREYNPIRRIGTSNPSVLKSGEFINKIFNYGYGGLNITIGENCKTSIYDYTYALEASDGTIDKKTIQNPVTKVRYQEFGHCSDLLRYFMVQAFPAEYSKLLSGERINKPVIGLGRAPDKRNSY